MSTIKLPTYGLPQEVINIPFGQVVLLTNPQEGILTKTTHMIEFILSMAKDYKLEHNINTMPVQFPGLWDCFVCKVKTDREAQILISDKGSLVEMLCEFWGLDYEDVRKSYKLPDRYKRIGMTCGGDSHPERVSVTPVKKPGEKKDDDYSVTLECLKVYTKEEQLDVIEDVLENSFNHNIDISIGELATLWEKVKARERKTYHLEINIEPGEEDWDPSRTILVPRYDCDFCLVDSDGTPHSFTLEAKCTALYLTFILFSEGDAGIKLADLRKGDEFFKTYLFFCQRLKHIIELPDKETLGKYVNDKRKVIKKTIKDITTDDKTAQELFSIEGFAGDVYMVKGSTDENRAYIRKMFEME